MRRVSCPYFARTGKSYATSSLCDFLFPEERQQTFWMRNTYVALDMIFIRGDLRVLGVVESAEPLTDTQRAVPGKSRYVLEVPAGYALRHRIGPGVRVDFIDIGGFSTTH